MQRLLVPKVYLAYVPANGHLHHTPITLQDDMALKGWLSQLKHDRQVRIPLDLAKKYEGLLVNQIGFLQIYTAKPGDFLNKIANTFITSLDQIKANNDHIKSLNILYIGLPIKVPSFHYQLHVDQYNPNRIEQIYQDAKKLGYYNEDLKRYNAGDPHDWQFVKIPISNKNIAKGHIHITVGSFEVIKRRNESLEKFCRRMVCTKNTMTKLNPKVLGN